jgi:hypothetical protein
MERVQMRRDRQRLRVSRGATEWSAFRESTRDGRCGSRKVHLPSRDRQGAVRKRCFFRSLFSPCVLPSRDCQGDVLTTRPHTAPHHNLAVT